MSWVSWDTVCLPKEFGGLGVKHCGLFNLALLSKWKWKILNGGSALWSDIIAARYGNVNLAMFGGPCVSRKVSLWWRDVCAIWEPLNIDHLHSNWFSSSVSCKLGNGRSLDLWRHAWLGSSSFYISSLLCFAFVSQFFLECVISWCGSMILGSGILVLVGSS